jgi:hypothetical protein
MLYINLIILILFIAAILLSWHRPEEWLLKLDKKEHSLYIFYPVSHLILSKTGLYKILSKKKDITKYIKALYNNTKPELFSRLFWCKRVSSVLIILAAFNLISLLSILSANGYSYLVNSKYIKRPEYGEGKTNIELQVKMINDEKSADTKKQQEYGPYNLEIPVNEQSYTKEELEQIFQKAYSYLKSIVLGDNASYDLIYGSLNFIKTVPGTSINVKWMPDNYKLIRSDGSLINEDISSEGVWTNVTVILTYDLNNKKQNKEYSMSFKIFPRQYGEEELLQKKLKEKLEQADERTREDSYLELPKELGDYRLIWREDIKGGSTTLLILGIILAIAAWISGEKELGKKLKLRKEQMIIDYPEIINKFTLLINAGMTIKQAWLKIADDYERLTSGKENKKRYAYDEILTTAHELMLGVPENESYEQYGKRTGLIQYIKFTSLINQNLKKGTKGFTQQLMYEAEEAFEERKENAKRLGETAGTRLLGPMMVMLVIVLLMIMIPAFLSFRI